MPAIHPLVASYARRNQIKLDNERLDGRVTLTFDSRYRVHMYPINDSKLALEMRIMTLSDDHRKREEQLEKMLGMMAVHIRNHASACVFDSEANTLLLQQVIEPNIEDRDFDEALSDFLNMASFWTANIATLNK